MSTRGLVVAPRFTFDGKTLALLGSALDPGDLRYYLLYWDRIEWPDNNIISIVSSPDVQFLIDEGILTRSQVRVTKFSGNIGDAYIGVQVAAFLRLSAQEPGAWALGQTAGRFFVPDSESSPLRAIEIELYRALPAPPMGVAFTDILEFKKKRNSELLALRASLDALYLDVASSADVLRAKNAAIAQLERALTDLQAVAEASWGARILSSIKVEVKVSDAVLAAFGGGAAAQTYGLPVALGMAAGAAAASIKFERQSLRAPVLPDGLRDFAYLYHLHRDLH